MLKTKEQQRIFISFIFYIIAIGLAIIEHFIQGSAFDFSTIIIMPFPYFLYYVLISKTVDENIIWPLFILLLIISLISAGPSKNYNFICEMLEIGLFIVEVIVAFVVKIFRSYIVKKE